MRLRGTARTPTRSSRRRTSCPEVERCGLIGVVDRWMAAQGVALARAGAAEPRSTCRRARSRDQELAAELETTIAGVRCQAPRT